MLVMALRELRRTGHAPSLVLIVSGFGWLAGTTGSQSSGHLFLGVVAATAALAARNRHRSWRPHAAAGSLEVAV